MGAKGSSPRHADCGPRNKGGGSVSSTLSKPEVGEPLSRNPHLLSWIEECAALTRPERIVWCDGSEEEKESLTALAVSKGILLPLNPEKVPNSYLHRSDPGDVARVEHL